MNIVNIKTPLEIANTIKRQYCYNNIWSGTSQHSPEEIENIFKSLVTLKKGINDLDLVKILQGFKHWRFNNCDSCNLEKLEIMVNTYTDYEGNRILFCRTCLEDSLKILNDTEKA